MANFPGLLMKCRNGYYISGGCREQAFSVYNTPRETKLINAVGSYMSNYGGTFSFLREFMELDKAGFQFISKMNNSPEARKKVETILKASGVKKFLLGERNWAFNSEAPGAKLLAYILHATGRDTTEVVSADFPAPTTQFTGPLAIQSNSRVKNMIVDSFVAWTKVGMPIVKEKMEPRDHHLLVFGIQKGKIPAPLSESTWHEVQKKVSGDKASKANQIVARDTLSRFIVTLGSEAPEITKNPINVSIKVNGNKATLQRQAIAPDYKKVVLELSVENCNYI